MSEDLQDLNKNRDELKDRVLVGMMNAGNDERIKNYPWWKKILFILLGGVMAALSFFMFGCSGLSVSYSTPSGDKIECSADGLIIKRVDSENKK